MVAAGIALPAMGQNRMSADQFLDLAMGKTLHFHSVPSGQLVGIEEFLRRDLSVWKENGGTCVYGRVTIEAGQLCFLYDNERPDQKSCWFVLEDHGKIYVRTPELFRAEVQVVDKITDAPLECPNAPTS